MLGERDKEIERIKSEMGFYKTEYQIVQQEIAEIKANSVQQVEIKIVEKEDKDVQSEDKMEDF